MTAFNEALNALKGRIGAGAVEIYDGIVVSVEENKYTVDVKLGDEEDAVVLPEVKLRSVVNEAEKAGVVYLPKKDSHIVFCKIEGLDDYALIKTSEIDKVIVEIETVKMTIDKTGYAIKKGNVSLKDIFSDLKTLLENFKVNTPSGPSVSLLPDTMTALVQLETKFNNLLK